jgi:hypothetical protein
MGFNPAEFTCDNECGSTVPMNASDGQGWLALRPVGKMANTTRYFCSEFCLISKLTLPELSTEFELPPD